MPRSCGVVARLRLAGLAEVALVALLAACGGGAGGGASSSGGSSSPPPEPLPPPPAEPACVALDVSGTPVGSPPLAGGSACTRTSIGLAPITDLGAGTYQGFQGGLYCGGLNTRPSAHEAAGVALAQGIVPMDAAGLPSANGKYVLVSIGMSNTTQEFSTFVPIANADPLKRASLVVVDGAQGGQDSQVWANAASPVWTTVDSRLAAAGVTPAQVAVAWVKLARISPSQQFPADVAILAPEIAQTLRNLRARYPGCRMAYLSSRIYAGYATTTLNPEPYAYQSAFAVKKVVLDQVTGSDATLAFTSASGTPPAPWLAWGPYLWADGLTPRSDGLTWSCSDLNSDGTHPSSSGRTKVANLLLQFFQTDTTAREWYLAAP